ncbi:MAG: YfhO family protein [Bacteroidetes bacterium]|nr:YfhO family protein [Bacteroidota bacterium]
MKQKLTHPPHGKKVTRPIVKKEVSKPVSKPFFLDPYMEKYGLWIALGLVSLLILIIFNKFIAGNVYYLFKDIGSDSLNGWFPNIVTISKYLHTDGLPLWSHSTGMGQNIMAGSVTDPFTIIVYLFGKDNLESGVIWMEICKIFLTCFLMFLFLKLWKLTPGIIIIGSLLYCFGGFMIVGGGWYGFSTEAFYLVLLLFSFEKLYRNNEWYLFPLVIALIASNQPVSLYFYGLFLILYFLFRHFSSDNPSWKKFGKLVLQMAGMALLGLIMSSFFLVSHMQMLLDSPRVGGNSSHSAQLLAKPALFIETSIYYSTAILRLFSNDLLGNGSNFKGWYNYLEAPMWYIGFLPMLLMPQIFLLGTRRRKIAYGCFLVILLIPVIFPFFRYAVWLFTGDYYRGYSVFVSLFLLFSAMDVLHEVVKGKKINLYLLAGTLFVLLALLYYPYESTENLIDKGLRNVITNFFILYTIILFLSRLQSFRSFLVILLVLVVFFEMAYLNYKTVNDRIVLSKMDKKEKLGYDDYTVEAIGYIKAHDLQYQRINKDYRSSPAMHSSLNDAKVQGYNGTTSYHSFNQKYYIRFLEEMNIIQKGDESQSRWAIGLVTRPLLQNLASTKYNLCRWPASQQLKLSYDSITKFGDVSLFRNRHFLPLGFTYGSYIQLSSFQKASTMMRDQIIQQAFVAEDQVDPGIRSFKTFNFTDTLGAYTFDRFFKDVDLRKQDTLSITQFSENRIRGTISPKTKKLLFFSIPYDKGWHGLIDGKSVQPMLCNIGFMGFIIEPGKHKVELFYRPPWFNESFLISILTLLIYLVMIAIDHFYFQSKRKHEFL